MIRIIHILSNTLFWIGYPFFFLFKKSAQLFLFAVRKGSEFGERVMGRGFAALSHAKVPRKRLFQSLSAFFQLSFKDIFPFHRIHETQTVATSETQSEDSKLVESLPPVHHERKEETLTLFSYEWFDTAKSQRRGASQRMFRSPRMQFVWNHWTFELSWWWQHGSWRKQIVPQPKMPQSSTVVSALKGVHVPIVFGGVVFCVVAVTAAGYWSYTQILVDLPSPSSITDRTPKLSTRIYDREGNVLYKIFKEENRTYVPLEEMSPYVVQATLAIEDSQFYEHWGISLRGIGRAFWHNVQSDTLQGGSTITQQLVKNTLLTPERTWERKIKEVLLALAVDAQFSKQQILEMYLNEVNYGGSIYGVEEASQWFFGKSASELSIAESALIAGLPVAPTAYSPFGTQPERAQARQQEVLQRMADIGVITPEQYTQARKEKLAFRTAQFDIASPHFVMYVRELLVAAYGEEMVSQGGLEVHTSLDPALQASAEAAVAEELSTLARLNVSNGAALVTNPKTGEILAMVGSRNYFDQEHDGQVNIVLQERQPGSSIKPITYALAFENGKTPQSTVEDVPVVYTAQGAPPYKPRNYGGQFYGTVSLRDALANSRNIPAVRLLAEFGVPQFVTLAERLGITTWEDRSRHGLAMTLGSNEVTMYDMAKVYGTFANGGERVDLNPIVSVYDHSGNRLYWNPCSAASAPCNGEKVLSALASYQLTSVLSDNQARARAFGLNSVLNIPGQEVAVKTGTTNSLRDNWTIGYTNDRVVVTWVGNNDNTPMSAVASGVTGASPIWNEIMSEAIGSQSHQFALPAGLQRVSICASTGTLPCDGCPNVIETVLPSAQVPQKACSPAWFTHPTDGATEFENIFTESRTARL